MMSPTRCRNRCAPSALGSGVLQFHVADQGSLCIFAPGTPWEGVKKAARTGRLGMGGGLRPSLFCAHSSHRDGQVCYPMVPRRPISSTIFARRTPSVPTNEDLLGNVTRFITSPSRTNFPPRV